MEQKFFIRVTFTLSGSLYSAAIDIPEQGVKNLSLSKVSFSNPKVHFELDMGKASAFFDGLFYGDSISGIFRQAGVEGTFILTRRNYLQEELPYPEDLPYNYEEVFFENGDIILSGTLSYPIGEGTFPAVILISGSGPQTRDEDISGFKVFKVLADHLTKNGLAVLRYDDRGVGKSTGKSVNESTTEELATDVIAAVKYLQSRDNIIKNKIGLLGHSEGGIVAPIAAVNYPDVAFIVLMAGTGVKGIDILKEQSKLLMKAENSSEEEINSYIGMIETIYETLKKNKSLDDVKEKIKDDLISNFDRIPENIRKGIKNKYEYAEQIAELTVSQFSTPWMKFFLDYDPYEMLTRVKCPVLALLGEKDLQVSASQNRKFIEEALSKSGNADYQVVVIKDANHLFQKALTGSISEYSKLPSEFTPEFLDTVTSWIKKRAGLEE